MSGNRNRKEKKQSRLEEVGIRSPVTGFATPITDGDKLKGGEPPKAQKGQLIWMEGVGLASSLAGSGAPPTTRITDVDRGGRTGVVDMARLHEGQF